MFRCNTKQSKLLERSLLVLRKLTCSPKSFSTFTKRRGAISKLLWLCQHSTTTTFQSAFTVFHRVTADRQLVGCVVANEHVHPSQCVYSLDLYDTTGDEDVSVREVLMKSGYFSERCEGRKSCKDGVGVYWVCVMVDSQLGKEMKFTAKLKRIENVGSERILLPVNGGKVG